jgi:Leucine-rich repeat (LRR) protein
VRSVAGLGSFSSLSWLNLGGNAISDIRELAVLLALRSVMLDDNQIEDAGPLYRLPELAVVNLNGNSALRCPGPDSWISLERLTLPRHCR